MNTNITKQMEMILYRTEMNELDKEVVVAKIATTTQHGAVEKNKNQGNQLLSV